MTVNKYYKGIGFFFWQNQDHCISLLIKSNGKYNLEHNDKYGG